MNKEIFYSLKVWVTACVAGPTLLVGYDAMRWNSADLLDAWMMYVMFGAIFSVPSVLLLCFVTAWVRRWIPKDIVKIKMVLSVAGIGFTTLPFMILFRSYTAIPLTEASIYTLVITAGIWFYQLAPREGGDYHILDEGHRVH